MIGITLALSQARSGGASVASSGYEGVAAATMAARELIVDEFAADWPGYEDQGFYSSVTVTSSAALRTQIATLEKTDLTRWHRVILDSTVAASNWSASADIRGYGSAIPEGIVTTGHLYGSTFDRASSGGGIVVESSNPASPVAFQAGVTVNGYRGVHFRDVNFAQAAATADGTARDAAVCLTVQKNASFPEAPVVRFERCGIGLAYHLTETDVLKSPVGMSINNLESAAIVDCVFNGVQTGVKSTGARFWRYFGNDFQRVIGDAMYVNHTVALVDINSTWDERVIGWTRLNTMRRMVDSAQISQEHTDFFQCGQGGDLGDYSILHEFDVMHGRRLLGTDGSILTFTANPVDTSSITVGGTTFEFVASGATGTQVNIAGTLSLTLDALKTVVDANLPASLYSTTKTSTTMRFDFYTDQWTLITRTTSPSAGVSVVGSPTRYAGGTQGHYHDDTPISYNIDSVAINCMAATNDAITGTCYNGTGIIDRCTAVRPSEQPPDPELGTAGFASSAQDVKPYYTSSRKTDAVTVDHTFRSCVMDRVLDKTAGGSGGTFRTADGTYTGTLATVTMANNRFTDWFETAAGNAPADMFSGTFTTDAQGRFMYTMLDDGSNTQAAFRAAMYAQFKLLNTTDRAGIGATDPATWPSS